MLAARRQDELAKVAAELDPDGKRTAHRATDITDPDSCAALVELAQERFGSVDALIQVAAFEHAWGGLHDLNLDDWRTAFDTNVLGALTVLRPVAKAMKESGGGSVVFIGSQSMFKPAHAPGRLRRVQGRAADDDLLPGRRARARQHPLQHGRSPRGCGAPTSRCTSSGTARQQGRTEDEVLHDLVGDFPLRRMTEDGEVADVAMFFASDHAKAVTGQYLLVNAGEMFR